MRKLVMALVILTTFTASCSSLETSTELHGPGSSIISDQPGFDVPWPGEERSPAAVITELEALGNETYRRSASAVMDGDTLLLPAATNDLCYAIYGFHVGSYNYGRIYFDLSDVVNPQNVWIGISYYTDGGWSWDTYTPGVGFIDVDAGDIHNDAGYAYLTIATYNQANARVNRAYIQVLTPTWSIHSVDNLNAPDETSSMTIIGDQAAIVYERGDGLGGYQLRLAKAANANPTETSHWDMRYVIDTYPEKVMALEAVGVGNVPGFAYVSPGFIPGTVAVVYGHGKNALPNDLNEWYWSSLGVGNDTYAIPLGLANIGGNPAVTYEGIGGGGGSTIVYTRATKADPEGDADWQEVTFGLEFSPTQNYGYQSLFNLQGGPAVFYYDQSIALLRYAYSDLAMPSGLADFTFATVESLDIGRLCAGLEYGGLPAALYIEPAEGYVQYARGIKVDPISPGDFLERHIIDEDALGVDDNDDIAVALVDGSVGVAYREFPSGALKYAWSTMDDPDSGSAWRIVTVDPGPTQGSISIIEMVDGYPGICYHTVVPPAMNFAHMVP